MTVESLFPCRRSILGFAGVVSYCAVLGPVDRPRGLRGLTLEAVAGAVEFVVVDEAGRGTELLRGGLPLARRAIVRDLVLGRADGRTGVSGRGARVLQQPICINGKEQNDGWRKRRIKIKKGREFKSKIRRMRVQNGVGEGGRIQRFEWKDECSAMLDLQ